LSGESGFTIAEVALVAVFVVGLLAVIVVSARGITNDTRTSDCQTELRTLKMAVAEYQANNDVYPGSVDAVISARLAERRDVDRWIIVGGGGEVAPTYRSAGGCPSAR